MFSVTRTILAFWLIVEGGHADRTKLILNKHTSCSIARRWITLLDRSPMAVNNLQTYVSLPNVPIAVFDPYAEQNEIPVALRYKHIVFKYTFQNTEMRKLILWPNEGRCEKCRGRSSKVIYEFIWITVEKNVDKNNIFFRCDEDARGTFV